jgi:hypothetical protein
MLKDQKNLPRQSKILYHFAWEIRDSARMSRRLLSITKEIDFIESRKEWFVRLEILLEEMAQ